MSLRRLTAAVAVMALAAACTQPEAEQPPQPVAPSPAPQTPPTPPVGYACESGQTVEVRYPDASTAQVTYKGQSYTLRSVVSASGARYAGSGLEWWSAARGPQETATLSRLGPNEDVGVAVLERCSRPTQATAPGEPAPQPGPATPGAATPASAPCRGPQLKLAEEGGDAGAGNRVSILSLQNVGTAPCSLTGYPGVVLQDARGRNLTTVRTEQNPGSYFRNGQAPTPVELAPQAKAYFDMAWNVVPHEGQGERTCPAAARVRATAPGDTAGISLNKAFTPCGGRVQVSPVRPVAEPDRPAPQPVAPAATPART
ncbi:MAG TPA: DUF4232 domain-containing protein [Brevundimonas sp.]|uniref:DUF4232 domain-containing protein n=1 Tax=Brevundimonas sp. TaxID=1871086 RepID=UPI002634D1C8|nr:DUF4232 domain-containing protein [Brevundimonas sp.]HRO34338.1 DUF4232 domain-containing protein [Brevundimonas sp.]